MNLTAAKLSNYSGQAKDLKDTKKLDSHLVTVDRDLQNIWRLLNDICPFVGANAAVLTSGTNSGFSYIPLINTTPTATPTNYTGHCAIVFCNSDSNLRVFNTSNNNWKTILLT